MLGGGRESMAEMQTFGVSLDSLKYIFHLDSQCPTRPDKLGE